MTKYTKIVPFIKVPRLLICGLMIRKLGTFVLLSRLNPNLNRITRF